MSMHPNQCCKCKKPARYTRGKGRDEKKYCRDHVPPEVARFQDVAFRFMLRGQSRRFRERMRNGELQQPAAAQPA